MPAKELFYISNILSILRIILLIPLYYLLTMSGEQHSYYAVALMLVMGSTDLLDGKLARKLKQQSDLGRILDPIADKIAVALVAFLLVKLRDLPLWFLLLILARDLAILLAGLFLAVRSKIVVESNMIGKLTVSVIALMLILFTLRVDQAKWIFLWASVAMVVLSSISYAIKLFRIIYSEKQAT